MFSISIDPIQGLCNKFKNVLRNKENLNLSFHLMWVSLQVLVKFVQDSVSVLQVLLQLVSSWSVVLVNMDCTSPKHLQQHGVLLCPVTGLTWSGPLLHGLWTLPYLADTCSLNRYRPDKRGPCRLPPCLRLYNIEYNMYILLRCVGEDIIMQIL